MSDARYEVAAGYVTVETEINEGGARAQVDIPRGADLPSDVPQEQVDTLVARGAIRDKAAEPAGDSEPEPESRSEPEPEPKPKASAKRSSKRET